MGVHDSHTNSGTKLQTLSLGAADLWLSTCIELLWAARNRSGCCDVIETLGVYFPLCDHSNINCNMWPHTGKHHCFISLKNSRQRNYSNITVCSCSVVSPCAVYTVLTNAPDRTYHICLGWHHGRGFQTNGDCSLFLSADSCLCLRCTTFLPGEQLLRCSILKYC